MVLAWQYLPRFLLGLSLFTISDNLSNGTNKAQQNYMTRATDRFGYRITPRYQVPRFGLLVSSVVHRPPSGPADYAKCKTATKQSFPLKDTNNNNIF